MRLTEEQMKEVELNQVKYNTTEEILEKIEACKSIADCFQEDGSVAWQKGDIIITKKYFEELKRSLGRSLA